MWLEEPRWSSGPHFEGHRWASVGGCHDWDIDWETGLTCTVIAARTNAGATAMRNTRLLTGFILIPPQKLRAVIGAPEQTKPKAAKWRLFQLIFKWRQRAIFPARRSPSGLHQRSTQPLIVFRRFSASILFRRFITSGA
jgi:hypothetical protein